jgi:hypothetical protein
LRKKERPEKDVKNNVQNNLNSLKISFQKMKTFGCVMIYLTKTFKTEKMKKCQNLTVWTWTLHRRGKSRRGT